MNMTVELPAWLKGDYWQERLAAGLRKYLQRQDSREEQRMISGAELLMPVLLVSVLTLLVLGSAMGVILSAYEYRRLFNQHQILVQQWDELQVEWGQYLLEQSVWSSHQRIESLATQKLDMVVPETETIEIVRHEQK